LDPSKKRRHIFNFFNIFQLNERIEDMEFEKQTMAMSIDTKPAEIAGAGNSLFSEVEDRRRVTANELNELENK